MIKAVWEARVKWQEIGILLELPLADLRAIEKNYRYCDQRFQRMISMWLTQCNPQHIWKSLIAALKSPMVAWDRVAHDIERKYVAGKPSVTVYPEGLLSFIMATANTHAYVASVMCMSLVMKGMGTHLQMALPVSLKMPEN